MKKPYTEIQSNNYYVRTFSINTDVSELKWHIDLEDRIIKSTKTDWLFQFDNKLPITFDNDIFIPKNTYHRIIKGSSDLTLHIYKLN